MRLDRLARAIAELFARERERFAETPSALARAPRAGEGVAALGRADELDDALAGRVPGLLRVAPRAPSCVDVDGNVYADLCLGDTGAMTGHAPAATAAAVNERMAKGVTAMLPTEDAAPVGEEMQRRFGLAQLAVHALGDRREPLRDPDLPADHRPVEDPRPQPLLPRLASTRPSSSSRTARFVAAEGNVGPPVDPAETTRVVEINDLEGLERELAHGDVACVSSSRRSPTSASSSPTTATTRPCAS